jgi:Putative addiction module component
MNDNHMNTAYATLERQWGDEIARRIEELDSGKVIPIPWAEARRQVVALLDSEEP